MQSNLELLESLPSDTRLAGRTAIVTGSSSGIGEAIARVLAASGADVVVSGRDVRRTQGVVDAISAAGGAAHAVPADLSGGFGEIRDFAAAAVEALGGRADILVNNAGIYPVLPTAMLADDDLDAVLATNIRAPHVLVAELAPAMIERGTGAIVNIGSWMSRVGVPAGAAYTASKAALEQMTRTWSAEFGPHGVNVNTVSPGATATPGNVAAAEALAEVTRGTVAGTPVRPVDIAFAVRFLVSGEASFAHGTVLDIDGGIANVRAG
ncbi:SDR family oxidoreductase [Rhodococcus sp. BP-349]|uniref:SDR family NAD(P)-dependent oxidoreductase n=1 Tax=unclassified Rhodococcus (in: high G+C Gram-positive bacteria) TaxID=192944 RepID=UPI001C9B7BF6|nr:MULTISPECIES: SDR family oxidoreductase [unclassified Rhodococcus (in: high G+C Gram-positive bacteria)]MBY6537886.1 SDR family oxidoreductase [Rhodococcus sp. BP-363]MBY6542223.1 SDR family oxidoreductase [Rhodococcus sp. BP-369]MBY6561453.1 SDR family oxidoreductase [Rhodococcus sp. BP-370]MBY6575745.1 SDR family oxidoreductase [Rhodococcus sp. BP-364]MBY6585046.1 SDR family oxidoreductase [Rhodococcus sp. BP-358]